ncbi:glycosyltransferase [Dinghuibacter silviterrae]|uniref:Uncharacterized protein (TIGR00661 family) n=1 Tax=Dinghuibacter silviterrae TaxID=1539049 RepID=A0A4R8DP40_9BACT|nr:glycosyltransferase [Dinghuibacter silviterrae]TDW99823.1 uncharacterized protein (TIGR00661 family) [Dinghuibacter silviterrae]
MRILIAPLDWGLGHATRCIPLIRFFLHSGCDVWIASEGKTQQLLRQEFPSLTHVSLKGYRIRYAATRAGLVCKIIAQIPRILQTIRYEKRWLRQAVPQYKLDAVVSDNRFGLSHPDIPCVYLTHQLRIMAPLPSLVQRLHYRFINRFTACWVPDLPGTPNLSGQLGHPSLMPKVPVKYMGPLSRFVKMDVEPQISLLILLSGPEPQRTLFEKQILHQIGTIPGRVVLIRGLPGAPLEPSLAIPDNLVIYNHLPAGALNDLLSAAEWVVSRTGYTTVMDLVRLQKKSILVPTPGQTEQEYLGRYLRSEGIAYTTGQKDFSLSRALNEALAFPYRFPDDPDDVATIAGTWLETIRLGKI